MEGVYEMRTAVFTVVKNESVFLPLWLKHYSQFDLFVINHKSTDGSVERAKKNFNFTEFYLDDNSHYGKTFMKETGKQYQRKLLQDYDVVIFAEADEFIIVNPEKYKSLDDYITKMDKETVYCTGREVLQLKGERGIDWEKPILSQRKIWWPHPSYFKPAISKAPLNYVEGYHYVEEDAGRASKVELGIGEYLKSIADPDLIMVHLQKVDWNLFCNRGRFKKDKAHFQIGMNEKENIPEKWKGLL